MSKHHTYIYIYIYIMYMYVCMYVYIYIHIYKVAEGVQHHSLCHAVHDSRDAASVHALFQTSPKDSSEKESSV